MIIAIDTGANGGVAWHDPYSQRRSGPTYLPKPLDAVKLPESRGDMISLFDSLFPADQDTLTGRWSGTAYIEKVNGFNPGNQGHTFQFGRNVERPECILETLGVRIILVTPQAWQKALGLGHRDRPPALPRNPTKDAMRAWRSADAKCKREWKQKLLAEAQRRFPGVEITLATSDALLILDYGRMMENGGVKTVDIEQEVMG